MRIFYLLILVFLLLSCKNNTVKEQKQEQEIEQTSNSSPKITNSMGEILTPENRKLVENWQEYKNVEALIDEYYNITPQKALNNAENLVNAIKQLKDSIRIEKFKSNDIKIRINVLYNNSLNLSQLNKNITKNNESIEHEVSNTIAAFSALNSKLNNIVQQEILEEELKDFNN